ncbi:MAG: serine/arginine repetitive matrix protein 2 [Jatrophihabitans sp.]|nr:serine/arginine repetitive matrix protein 2 [Jatrophihabitans sp.]
MTSSRPAGSGADRTGTSADEQWQRLQALHDTLTAAVTSLASGDVWQQMLRAAATFHHYSPNNVLLITAQSPHAQAVAGYQTWKQLDRQVRKGEKGIAILAPVVRRPRRALISDPTSDRAGDPTRDTVELRRPPARGAERDAVLATTSGSPTPTAGPADPSDPLAPSGDPHAAVRRLAGFRVVHVFDITQTDGPDLPEPPRPELLGGAAPAGLLDGLARQAETAGFTVHIGGSLNDGRTDFTVAHPGLAGANGVTDFGARTVQVRPGLSDAQTVKTLAHELGHVLLHEPADRPAAVTREIGEVEAESVAYIVAAAHGLDTTRYTAPYVAGWAAGDVELLRLTAERVLTTARQVLTQTPPEATYALPDRLRTPSLTRDPQLQLTHREPTRELAPEPPVTSRLATTLHPEQAVDPAIDQAIDRTGSPGLPAADLDQGGLW